MWWYPNFANTQNVWHPIQLDSNRILRSAYESELEIHNAGGTSWATFVAKLLELIDHDSCLHTPKQDIINQSTSMKSEVNTEIAELYFQYNYKSISEHNKLRTYVNFKTSVGREKYLDLEDFHRKKRNLSVHLESVVMIWWLKGDSIAPHPSH